MFHREEIKKINRDKAQLSERLKEAEGAQLRLDGEVHSLKAAAAVSGERHDASMAQLEKRLQRAQEAVQAKQDEVRTTPPRATPCQSSTPSSACTLLLLHAVLCCSQTTIVCSQVMSCRVKQTLLTSLLRCQHVLESTSQPLYQQCMVPLTWSIFARCTGGARQSSE